MDLPGLEVTDIGRPVHQIAGGWMGVVGQTRIPPRGSLLQLLTAEQGLRAVAVDAAYALGNEDWGPPARRSRAGVSG